MSSRSQIHHFSHTDCLSTCHMNPSLYVCLLLSALLVLCLAVSLWDKIVCMLLKLYCFDLLNEGMCLCVCVWGGVLRPLLSHIHTHSLVQIFSVLYIEQCKLHVTTQMTKEAEFWAYPQKWPLKTVGREAMLITSLQACLTLTQQMSLNSQSLRVLTDYF